MERLEQLINRLKAQFEKKDAHAQMLVTLKQIEAELLHSVNKPGSSLGTAKVAVVMPTTVKISHVNETVSKINDEEIKSIEVEEIVIESKEKKPEKWNFDPLREIPTLAHQEQPKELNDMIGSREASLNDKLKSDITELAASLKNEPIKDLKKAIGINDRYVFISELFRGDEAMYERSIKTINNFRILYEAEYWIERELKLKLSWDETRESSKHFYQLVKRRFS